MYPYDPYNNSTSEPAGEQSELLQQVVEPRPYNANSGYAWQPCEKRRPKGKAPRVIAAALGITLLSSAAGGGTALWVLNSQPAQPEAQAAVSTVLTASGEAGGSPVADSGTIAAVAQAAADSVVEIYIKGQQERGFFGRSLVEGSGSGVIISEDGYIVTNNHVVENSESIVVRTNDGTEYDGVLVGTDEQTDLAVVKVDATGLQAITFADSDNIQVGDLAVAIGNPLGELGGTVTSGIISATGREVSIDGSSTMTLLQTSAAINPGNSGGGLFDSNGHLIGIVNAKSAGVEIEGLGFAIPANTVQKVVPDIIDNGYVTGRAAMGIQVVSINDTRTAMMYGVDQFGVYIADPGENENLQAGDRFVFLDGQSIATGADITKVLQEHESGDTIPVSLVRDGKEVQTEVTLREQVPASAEAESQPDDL